MPSEAAKLRIARLEAAAAATAPAEAGGAIWCLIEETLDRGIKDSDAICEAAAAGRIRWQPGRAGVTPQTATMVCLMNEIDWPAPPGDDEQ